MAETQEQPAPAALTPASPAPVAPEQDPGFDARHKKELGVGTFAKETAFNNILPLATGGAGVGLGLALAKPVTAALPKKFVRSTAATEALGSGAWDLLGDMLKSGAEALGGNTATAIERLQTRFKTTPENALKVIEIFHGQGGKDEKLFQIAEILKPGKVPKLPASIKWTTAGITGFLGLIGGSIAIGYRGWRKKESARLAAEEINKDIAGMELFKPSNPELAEENKRLRTMVAALPTIDPATAESQGRVENRQVQAAVG